MTNTTKIVIGVVIVLVVALGAYMFFGAPQTQAPANENDLQASNTNNPSQVTPSPETPAPTPTTPSSPPAQMKATVLYTNQGFSPNTITIQKGGTVTFTNNSSEKMWVASAMHPTHTGYPEKGGCFNTKFDPSCGIAPGGSWSFTFNLTGEWGYHNHLDARYFGKVVVTE